MGSFLSIVIKLHSFEDGGVKILQKLECIYDF